MNILKLFPILFLSLMSTNLLSITAREVLEYKIGALKRNPKDYDREPEIVVVKTKYGNDRAVASLLKEYRFENAVRLLAYEVGRLERLHESKLAGDLRQFALNELRESR